MKEIYYSFFEQYLIVYNELHVPNVVFPALETYVRVHAQEKPTQTLIQSCVTS